MPSGIKTNLWGILTQNEIQTTRSCSQLPVTQLIISLYLKLTKMKNSQWQSFSGLCLFVSLVGTTYAFSVYSPLLESVLGFTTEDLDVIASVGNTGLYLSIITGFVYEEMGLHFVVGIGAILIFIGV